MKARYSWFLLSILLIFSTLILLKSCSTREETSSCFPRPLISVQLNLNMPSYFSLQNVGGWVYISEQQSGSRGLIVTRTSSSEFRVYDRNAPHLCPDLQTTLEVENGSFVVCRKDNAKWFLNSGSPATISPYGLKQYFYSYDSATQTLNIFN